MTCAPDCGWERSCCATKHRCPRSSIPARVSCAPDSSEWKVMPTSNPSVASSSAVALPIPESAPVTMARRGCAGGVGMCPRYPGAGRSTPGSGGLDGEHPAARVHEDLLGDRAHNQLPDRGTVAHADDDDVGIGLRGHLQDLVGHVGSQRLAHLVSDTEPN